MADKSKCPSCGGEVTPGKVDVERRWQGRLVIIEGVPAHICRQCGETYFDGEVVMEMERLKKAVSVPGERYIQVPVRPFKVASQ
ncbi:type II toxin-antitoxin system MqsA family antitoxin [Desulfovirgula thermocuniculi]|uniref:type II toxin-antitoxin system MqsA family antitoxin n=1 Tax=Desulfovirgula thermocuniculi TaxID=348842 RepID=UPI0004010E8F|nr:type II toxin-antitoxin system MqsA family antitoxin [Desulfovirgula thermocuniculi]